MIRVTLGDSLPSNQPLHAEQENLWFAVGMPDSPFATLNESAKDGEAEF